MAKERGLADIMRLFYYSQLGGTSVVDNSDHDTLTEADDPPLSDGTLLRRFQSGEDDAATAIYLRYAKRLQRLAESQTGDELAVRLDPEDVVQSVFRTFFRRAAKGHYEIPDGEELWKLFLVIALNKVRTLGQYHRAAKRDIKQTKGFPSTEPVAASGGSPDEQAYNVLRMTIDDVLKDLSKSQREMIMLRIEGNDINAITETTSRAKRSVERVLQKFRETLSEQLKDE
jgi:DNA-directed RNA polymerase specialized sigma24 family protein